jgi:hypothetical protein
MVDHLVYATHDLEGSIDELEECLGVRAALGGRHPGRGTRNALLALGERRYLEILGPDPEQPAAGAPRWFMLDEIAAPRLVTWAAKAKDLEGLVERAARTGVRLGPVAAGSRVTREGVTLNWRFSDPGTVVAEGLAPFFIDWGESPHPAATAPRGVELVGLRMQHPEAERVREVLAALGIEAEVEVGAKPELVATLRTGRGMVEIR